MYLDIISGTKVGNTSDESLHPFSLRVLLSRQNPIQIVVLTCITLALSPQVTTLGLIGLLF